MVPVKHKISFSIMHTVLGQKTLNMLNDRAFLSKISHPKRKIWLRLGPNSYYYASKFTFGTNSTRFNEKISVNDPEIKYTGVNNV